MRRIQKVGEYLLDVLTHRDRFKLLAYRILDPIKKTEGPKV